jgi:hypothetical protein
MTGPGHESRRLREGPDKSQLAKSNAGGNGRSASGPLAGADSAPSVQQVLPRGREWCTWDRTDQWRGTDPQQGKPLGFVFPSIHRATQVDAPAWIRVSEGGHLVLRLDEPRAGAGPKRRAHPRAVKHQIERLEYGRVRGHGSMSVASAHVVQTTLLDPPTLSGAADVPAHDGGVGWRSRQGW